MALYHRGDGRAPPEVIIDQICEAFTVDPVRALEVWVEAPGLVTAVMDARGARDVYRQAARDPRGMGADSVTFYVDLEDRAEKALRAYEDPEEIDE